MKTFHSTFGITKLSGEDPVLIFYLLIRSVEKTDTIGVSEAYAFLVLPKFLKGRDEQHFRSIRNGALSGGAKYWPEVANYLLRLYATPQTIRNAVNDLRNIRKQHQEDDLTYSGRLNNAAQRFANVYDEIDKMTLFLNGLLPSI